jgi:hypothetical protein
MEGESLVDYAIDRFDFAIGADGEVVVVLDRPAGADEATVIPEWSADLGVWSSEGLILRSQGPSLNGGVTQVWHLQNAAAAGRMFLRGRVVQR